MGEFLTLSTLEFVTRCLQALASIGILAISIFVYRWTRRRDAADFFRSSWSDQQNTNLMHLSNEKPREMHEKMVYGLEIEEKDYEVLFFVLFTKINRVLQFYNAFREGIISRESYVLQTKGTLKLLGHQRDIVEYLVCERGYSDSFRKELIDRLEDVDPPITLREWRKAGRSKSLKVSKGTPTPLIKRLLGFPPNTF